MGTRKDARGKGGGLSDLGIGSGDYLPDRKLRVSVARVAGRLYAFADLCTCTSHEACPLSGGLLTGTTIMCQCHGSRFDITDGAVIDGAASRALETYEVDEAHGTIQIRA